MEIIYKDKKTEKICTNLKEAKKELAGFATDLLAKINFIERATSFSDIRAYVPFHCHQLHGDKNKYWALDIKGRKCSWRLIIAPLDADHNIITAGADFSKECVQIKIILVEEVSNHYE